VTELIDARRNFANLPTNYTYVNRVWLYVRDSVISLQQGRVHCLEC
jgi:hypothetical protein